MAAGRSRETAQEGTATSVAPASVEITPKTLDVQVGQKVKFSASAKDASGNPIDAKPSVWFAAPFDLAGADDTGEVTFHSPGVVTVGAVIAGKSGYATVNVANSKVTKVDIEPLEHAIVAGSAEKLTRHRPHREWQSSRGRGRHVDVGQAVHCER